MKHLDFYCERTSTDFWAEPINAWSNLAFIVAGLWGVYQWRKTKIGIRPLVLSGLVLTVGIGSFLFHTFADSRTHLADLIPIFVFTCSYLYYSFRHLLHMTVSRASGLMISFVSAMALIEFKVPKTILNGSLLYLPPLILLFYVGMRLKNKDYLTAAFVFLLSLVFRTLDAGLCETLPMGTHFLWHLLNGLCLGLLLKVSLSVQTQRQTI